MKTPPPEVVAAAQAADKKWGVFASVTLAQWALESDWGQKTTGACNCFGIKGSPGTLCWTHEQRGSELVRCQQLFRNFPGQAAAFDEHARLIATGAPYREAMAHKTDLTSFVRLMAAHYATDKGYAGKLLELIQEEGFTRYDVSMATLTREALA